MSKLEDLRPNAAVRGILPDGLVTVVNAQWFGSEALELTYKTSTGKVANELPACCSVTRPPPGRSPRARHPESESGHRGGSRRACPAHTLHNAARVPVPQGVQVATRLGRPMLAVEQRQGTMPEATR